MDYQDLKKCSLKEVVALTLRENPDSPVMGDLMACLPDMRSIIEITISELQAIKGLGRTKALHLLAVVELAKRLIESPRSNPPVIRTPQDAYNLVQDMKLLDREHFRTILLNTKNHVIGIETISIGSLNSSLVHPREVFKGALKRSSAAIILVHNHPSSDPLPSREDVEVTKRLIEAGKLGIDVLDHVVIGNDRYASLKERADI